MGCVLALPCTAPLIVIAAMAPAMKSMKAKSLKALSKGGICDSLAVSTALKKKECSTILDALTALGTKEVKKTGKFVLPGLCMIKTRIKPATVAGKREIFGKLVQVKAMKARTVVKAFAVSTIKKAV